MKQLSPYEVMQAEVDRIHQDGLEPDKFFLKATAVLASYGDQNQGRNAEMCASAIITLNDDDRNAFLSTYELPSRVYQAIASGGEPSDPPPEQLGVDNALNNALQLSRGLTV